MSNPTFTILRRERARADGSFYRVLADTAVGMSDFVASVDDHILPGSTVDVDDLQTVFRLRNDGEWKKYKYYGPETTGETEDPETAAAAAILDELVPDEAVSESDTGESEEAAE